jgi:hypothetical protein
MMLWTFLLMDLHTFLVLINFNSISVNEQNAAEEVEVEERAADFSNAQVKPNSVQESGMLVVADLVSHLINDT